LTNLPLLRALAEASAKLQECYQIAKREGHEAAPGIYAANVRVATLIGELVTSSPRVAGVQS
jgi:hypothetical protein